VKGDTNRSGGEIQLIRMGEENLKPGQKQPTPTPGNGDRVFYETLFRQRPDSQMAQEW